MDDIALHKWISEVRRQLEARAAKPPPFYWHDGDAYEYCWECFGKQFPTESPAGGYAIEMDGCVHCAVCDRLLGYMLTNYGADEGLAHYEVCKWDWNDPDDCYHVAAMLGCWIGGGAWKVEHLPDRERVITALRNGKNVPEKKEDKDVRLSGMQRDI